jgi:hypothetical protein
VFWIHANPTRLYQAVGDQSTPLQGLVVPLVRESLAPGKAGTPVSLHIHLFKKPQPMQNLDEDALTLWLTALLCAVPMPDTPPPLFELFPIAISLLHDNLDLLGKITSIVESYYLLGANIVLQVRHPIPWLLRGDEHASTALRSRSIPRIQELALTGLRNQCEVSVDFARVIGADHAVFTLGRGDACIWALSIYASNTL